MSLTRMDFSGSRAVTGQAAEDEVTYHLRRGEEELQIAQGATAPAVRRFHYHLAALHLDRAYAAEAPAGERRAA